MLVQRDMGASCCSYLAPTGARRGPPAAGISDRAPPCPHFHKPFSLPFLLAVTSPLDLAGQQAPVTCPQCSCPRPPLQKPSLHFVLQVAYPAGSSCTWHCSRHGRAIPCAGRLWGDLDSSGHRRVSGGNDQRMSGSASKLRGHGARIGWDSSGLRWTEAQEEQSP